MSFINRGDFMPGFNIDPNFIKQQQEFMRGNALRGLKEKPQKAMSTGKLLAVICPIFAVMIIILIVFFDCFFGVLNFMF